MNWGYKLMLTFIVFASLMSYLVYRAVNTDFQLVEKEYYKSELSYQDVIDGTNRVNGLSAPVRLVQENAGIILRLPAEMEKKQVEGTIWFYCPYDASKDRKLDLQPDTNGMQVISSDSIPTGTYKVRIRWT
ncbi:MAG: hypothetical protein EOO01_37690, partial [Chitinophagaceae bacterium]